MSGPINLNADSTKAAIQSFKITLFIWEVIIAAIVFIAAYFILKNYKKKELEAREKNKKYNTGG